MQIYIPLYSKRYELESRLHHALSFLSGFGCVQSNMLCRQSLASRLMKCFCVLKNVLYTLAGFNDFNKNTCTSDHS